MSDEVATIAMNRLVQGGGKKKLAVLPSLETIPKETTKDSNGAKSSTKSKTGKRRKKVTVIIPTTTHTPLAYSPTNCWILITTGRKEE